MGHMRRVGAIGAAVAVTSAGLAWLPLPAVAVAATANTLVSVDTTGTAGDDFSGNPAISGNGRIVAFQSAAPDLVAGDGNGTHDIFVRDMAANTTRRVSVDTGGGDPNGPSLFPAVSADGTFVAFISSASDLVAGDNNGRDDVFLRNLTTNSTIRITAGHFDNDATRLVHSVSVSGNGRLVAYDLSVGSTTSPTFRAFVRDTVANTTVRVSVFPNGSPASGFGPVISADGRFVAFSSTDALIASDDNGIADVYRRDLVERASKVATLNVDHAFTTTGEPFGSSLGISGDGRWVTFMSYASDLVLGDGNGEPDIFRRDLTANETVRVNVTSAGAEVVGFGNFHTVHTGVSNSGRLVVFSSDQSGLTPNDQNGQPDVFLRDVDAGTTRLVSVASTGNSPSGFSYTPAISGDGKFVVFGSDGNGLASNDTNDGIDDVFRQPVTTIRLCDGKPATIVGTDGPETITGTPGDDVIVALGGADTVNGQGGNDSICGGLGKDVLSGGEGNDTLRGGDGPDNLTGGPGTDTCVGDADFDVFASCETAVQ